MHVAEPALPSPRDEQALAVHGEIADLLVGRRVDDDRADRHAHDEILAALAGHLPAHAVLAALGAEFPLVAEIDQRVDALVGDQPDAAAGTAVTAVRSAERDELLAPEADAAVAAVAGMDFDGGFVDEFHGKTGNGEWGIGNGRKRDFAIPALPFRSFKRKAPRWAGLSRNVAARISPGPR